MRYITTIVLSLLLAIPFISNAQTVAFSTDLHYGMANNADVEQLQEFLTEQGVYNAGVTGNFYALTLQGVKNFQKAEGIKPVSGYVGVITRGVINQIIAMEAPSSEENATTTQPIIDLSQNTSTISNQTTTPQTQSTATPQVATAPTTQTSAPSTPTVEPFEVYQFSYEHGLGDFYYAGNKQLATSTINGVTGEFTMNRHIPDDCIYDSNHSKVCGYWVARIKAPHQDSDSVTLIATDNTSAQPSVQIIN